MLFPNQTLSELDLSLATPLGADLPLSTFNVGADRGPTALIMRQDAMLYTEPRLLAGQPSVARAASAPVSVLSDTVFVGDPLAQTSRALDLAGLAWLPWGASALTPGYITLGANATLYVRDVVLYNLQSATTDSSSEVSPAAEAAAPQTNATALLKTELSLLMGDMCNYTSLLWIFNMDRSDVYRCCRLSAKFACPSLPDLFLIQVHQSLPLHVFLHSTVLTQGPGSQQHEQLGPLSAQQRDFGHPCR